MILIVQILGVLVLLAVGWYLLIGILYLGLILSSWINKTESAYSRSFDFCWNWVIRCFVRLFRKSNINAHHTDE